MKTSTRTTATAQETERTGPRPLRRHRVLAASSLAALTAFASMGAAPSSADTTAQSTSAAAVTVPGATTTTDPGSATTPPTTVPVPPASITTSSSASGQADNKSATTTVTSPTRRGGVLNPHAQALNGAGSSFAAPAIETFTRDVGNAPYNLSINYSSTNSGDGRYEFTNQTTDFAVTDIAYGLGSTDTTPPSYQYIYVPITAGGIAFMYRIDGLSKTLQLDSYTTCAILTGGITNWNDSHIAALNPGVTLPSLHITPVTESDPAGTNYVLQEWCINQQPSLWQAFYNQQSSQSGGVTDGVPLSGTAPQSQWPGIAGGLDDQSTTAVASDVATNNGAIGAVQLQYASDEHFGVGNPAQGVVSEKNASGDYVTPTSANVASALAYATQLPNGTHQLNFNGLGPNVYNPSTYSYLLTPTTGWPVTKGAILSGFVNYALTLGQKESPNFGYASLGLSLEQYGVDQVTKGVPGAVPPTAAEQAAYSCGDLTPTEVQAGQTTPTCGVTISSPGQGGTGATATPAALAAAAAAAAAAHAAALKAAGGGSSQAGGGGVDPGVSLSGASGLAFTGSDPAPLVAIGLLLLGGGWALRRRALRSRRAAENR